MKKKKQVKTRSKQLIFKSLSYSSEYLAQEDQSNQQVKLKPLKANNFTSTSSRISYQWERRAKLRYLIFIITYLEQFKRKDSIKQLQLISKLCRYVSLKSKLSCNMYHLQMMKKYKSVQKIINYMKYNLNWERSQVQKQSQRIKQFIKYQRKRQFNVFKIPTQNCSYELNIINNTIYLNFDKLFGTNNISNEVDIPIQVMLQLEKQNYINKQKYQQGKYQADKNGFVKMQCQQQELMQGEDMKNQQQKQKIFHFQQANQAQIKLEEDQQILQQEKEVELPIIQNEYNLLISKEKQKIQMQAQCNSERQCKEQQLNNFNCQILPLPDFIIQKKKVELHTNSIQNLMNNIDQMEVQAENYPDLNLAQSQHQKQYEQLEQNCVCKDQKFDHKGQFQNMWYMHRVWTLSEIDHIIKFIYFHQIQFQEKINKCSQSKKGIYARLAQFLDTNKTQIQVKRIVSTYKAKYNNNIKEMIESQMRNLKISKQQIEKQKQFYQNTKILDFKMGQLNLKVKSHSTIVKLDEQDNNLLKMYKQCDNQDDQKACWKQIKVSLPICIKIKINQRKNKHQQLKNSPLQQNYRNKLDKQHQACIYCQELGYNNCTQKQMINDNIYNLNYSSNKNVTQQLTNHYNGKQLEKQQNFKNKIQFQIKIKVNHMMFDELMNNYKRVQEQKNINHNKLCLNFKFLHKFIFKK